MGRDGFGKDLSSLLLFSVVDLALDSLSTRFTSHDDLRGRWQMCTWSVLSNSPDNLRQRSLTISLTKIRVEVRKIFEKRYIWQIFSNQPISIWHHVNFLCKNHDFSRVSPLFLWRKYELMHSISFINWAAIIWFLTAQPVRYSGYEPGCWKAVRSFTKLASSLHSSSVLQGQMGLLQADYPWPELVLVANRAVDRLCSP